MTSQVRLEWSGPCQPAVFDVVVFSLFLEYLPCPQHRWRACHKALRLLRTQGLLLVITPDSKHVGHNAGMMKSWRQTLEDMGYCRYRYTKEPHLHCMAYRKTGTSSSATTRSELEISGLYIPQDINDVVEPQSEQVTRALRNNNENSDIAGMFENLPLE